MSNTLAPAAPARRTPGGRVRLIAAAALFVGWLSWLGYTALTKSHSPVVSHAQAAGAAVAVVAELTTGADGRPVFVLRQDAPQGRAVTELKEKADRPAVTVKVSEVLKGGGLEPGTTIGVTNLPSCVGYSGPGTYLLLLNKDETARVEGHLAYTLAGPQLVPGTEPAAAGAMFIYPWNEQTTADLRKQVEKLLP